MSGRIKCRGLLCQGDTEVIDSRVAADRNSIRRRRRCLSCRAAFTTTELVVQDSSRGRELLDGMARRIARRMLQRLIDDLDAGTASSPRAKPARK